MISSRPTVYVVDDDDAVRDALCTLLRSVDIDVDAFASADAFLNAKPFKRPSCLILDVRMPGMSGTELQQLLVTNGQQLPIIFVTGHAEVPMAVRAMKLGAVDFVEKPFDAESLLTRVREVLERDATSVQNQSEMTTVAERLGRLTRREKQVLERVIAGKPNKTSAAELGLSEKTIETYRLRLTRKMKAESLADLVRMVTELRIYSERSPRLTASAPPQAPIPAVAQAPVA